MANKDPLMNYAKYYGGSGINVPSGNSIYENNSSARENSSREPSSGGSDDSGLLGGAFKNMGKGGFKDLFSRLKGKFGKGIDSANFDPSDAGQVSDLQRQLGVTVDGQFGPETEGAYRKMVEDDRRGQGLDAYEYTNPEDGNIESYDSYGDGESRPSEAELSGMGKNPLNAAANNEPWYKKMFGNNTLGAGGYQEASQGYDKAEDGF